MEYGEATAYIGIILIFLGAIGLLYALAVNSETAIIFATVILLAGIIMYAIGLYLITRGIKKKMKKLGEDLYMQKIL